MISEKTHIGSSADDVGDEVELLLRERAGEDLAREAADPLLVGVARPAA